MVRWVTKYSDPVMATGWHMILGSLPLIALSASQEGDHLAARLSGLTGALCRPLPRPPRPPSPRFGPFFPALPLQLTDQLSLACVPQGAGAHLHTDDCAMSFERPLWPLWFQSPRWHN